MTKAIDLYLIVTRSNMHAGRGDSNYGIVDNEVQRDPVQELPVIFSSSLKGSLRELFERNLDKKHADIRLIFGNQVKGDTIQAGKYTFHEARLLTLPVRAEKRPFYNGTTPEILKELAEEIELFAPTKKDLADSLKNLPATLDLGQPQTEESGFVDEFKSKGFDPSVKQGLKAAIEQKLLQSPLALFHPSHFKSVCERLPIIARNQLEDGVSKNLFYEEVVPRQTRFTFFVERPGDNDALYTHLQNWNMRVQIGANASIGYGVCTFFRIFSTAKK